MRNLRRRIEALERSNLGRQQAIAERAMGFLQPDDVESLLAAYGAERVGRPLTECEEAAKLTYTEALDRGCRSAGLRAIAGADLVGAIAHGVVRVLASRMPLEELELCRSGLGAAQQGRPASDRESAAMQTYCSEMERISLLASFSSVAEFYARFVANTSSVRLAADVNARRAS
jgi:hypothetical protein